MIENHFINNKSQRCIVSCNFFQNMSINYLINTQLFANKQEINYKSTIEFRLSVTVTTTPSPSSATATSPAKTSGWSRTAGATGGATRASSRSREEPATAECLDTARQARQLAIKLST